MKVTSAYANKLIKSLEAEYGDLGVKERQEQETVLIGDEVAQDAEYNFAEMTAKKDEIKMRVQKIRHSINVFNTTTKVDGFDFTIDEVLMRLPYLNSKASALRKMKSQRKVTKSVSYGTSATTTTTLNYDLEEVEAEYKAVSDEIMRLQLALDATNLTQLLEIPD